MCPPALIISSSPKNLMKISMILPFNNKEIVLNAK